MTYPMGEESLVVPQILSRGKPDDDAPVHAMNFNEPLCRTGNWHVRYSHDLALVTCANCKAKMQPPEDKKPCREENR